MYREEKVFGGFVLVAILICCVIGGIWNSMTHDVTDRTVTICDYESVTNDNNNQYRVYAVENGKNETYVLEDSVWPSTWRNNTADYYGELQRSGPGVYHIQRFGYRLGLTSSFPNILEFEKLSDDRSACGAFQKEK